MDVLVTGNSHRLPKVYRIMRHWTRDQRGPCEWHCNTNEYEVPTPWQASGFGEHSKFVQTPVTYGVLLPRREFSSGKHAV